MAKPKRKKRNQIDQKWYVIGGAALAVLVIAFLVFTGGGTDTQVSTLPLTVSVQEAFELREQGALVLDVREMDEWLAWHVPGATLISVNELANRVDEVPRDQEILVICRTGNRSAQARDILLRAGFKSVTSVAGGITAWEANGLPIETGP